MQRPQSLDGFVTNSSESHQVKLSSLSQTQMGGKQVPWLHLPLKRVLRTTLPWMITRKKMMLVHNALNTEGNPQFKHSWPHSHLTTNTRAGSPACRSCSLRKHWETVLCKPSKVSRLSYSLCRVGWSRREAEENQHEHTVTSLHLPPPGVTLG